MNNVILVIIGMVLVTYIPRLIPFYMVSGKPLPKKIKLFLEFVPYTALGALLIPGGFTAISGVPVASVLGLSFAFFMSWKKGGLIVPVIGSILVVAGVLSLV